MPKRKSPARRRKEMPTWLAVLGVLLMLLLSPVLIPIAFWQADRSNKRQAALAQVFRCLRCGEVLGQAALDAAGMVWSAHLERLHRDYPTHRFRLVNKMHALCVHCGQPYCYNEEENVFEMVDGNDVPDLRATRADAEPEIY